MTWRSNLKNIFDEIPLSSTIFKKREAVRYDYVPDSLPHREKEVRKMALILSPVLKGSAPSNLFIYGRTGTGKTAVAKYVKEQLIMKAGELRAPVAVSYINCRINGTSYRVIVQLARDLGAEVPSMGLPYDEVYQRFLSHLEANGIVAVIFLDEIDQLISRGDDKALYSLVRINSELSRSAVSLVGITNDLKFKEVLDPRVVSALSDEELFFEPYNAEQLRDILQRRAELAFVDGALDEAVIPLIAAYAAQEGGDARVGIDLLRLAGEIAEREGSSVVTVDHVERAREKMRDDLFEKAIKSLPLHGKLVLYAIASLRRINEPVITTGKVYLTYRGICEKIGVRSLSKRSVSDTIKDLATLGLITYTIGPAERGRTKRITLLYGYRRVLDLLNNEI